tara:strand:+ start:1447 stop:1641 length:195 start_codon:yes stop_codon:yes gene_type:complete
MNKDKLINKLTLLDTSIYRKLGFLRTGKYTHEPQEYRKNLYSIYNELKIDSIQKLLKFKTYEQR